MSDASHLKPFHYQKGQSGNPRGRPPNGTDVRARARELAKQSSIEALATMVALMRSARDEKVRAAMAKTVWDVAQDVSDAQERDPSLDATEVRNAASRLSSEALAAIARGDQGGPSQALQILQPSEKG